MISPAQSEATFRRLFAGVLLAIGLGAADQTIVTTALPAIARDLDGLAHLSWIVIAYLLTSTAVTLVYGKLSDFYGRRLLMLVAISIFAAASVLCGFAHDVVQLALARALQGLGGGGLIVMAQATIADFVPPRERGRYQGYIAGVWAAASIAGPLLGGFFVDHLTWRWAFWINIPLSLIAFAIYWRAPFAHENRVARPRIDYAGIVLFSGAVTAFLFVATWAGTTYAWTSPQVLAMGGGGALLLAAFIAVERRAREPVLPPRIFANRTIRLTNLAGLLVSVVLFGGIVLLPVFVQLVLGVGAATSGVLLIPLLLGSTITSFLAGQIMRATGSYKWLIPGGMTVSMLAYALLATLTGNSPPPLVSAYGALLGLGIGFCFPVLNVTVQNAAEPRDLGVAVSTVTFSRTLGGAFGTAIFWSLLRAFSGGGQAHAFSLVFGVAAVVAAAGVAVALQFRADPLLTSSAQERSGPQSAA